eukprot:scaffold75_cov165-Amphora_coffeaeformis.AAC.24
MVIVGTREKWKDKASAIVASKVMGSSDTSEEPATRAEAGLVLRSGLGAVRLDDENRVFRATRSFRTPKKRFRMKSVMGVNTTKIKSQPAAEQPDPLAPLFLTAEVHLSSSRFEEDFSYISSSDK